RCRPECQSFQSGILCRVICPCLAEREASGAIQPIARLRDGVRVWDTQGWERGISVVQYALYQLADRCARRDRVTVKISTGRQKKPLVRHPPQHAICPSDGAVAI